WSLHAIQDERVAHLLDHVEDVVAGADQGVDVLPVERRDERRLEQVADVMADLVAAVLRVADLAGPSGLNVKGPDDPLEVGVRQLQDETEAAQWEQGQVQRDLAYLADLVGVGIIHLTDDMRVDVANTAAHVFLGRPPGTLRDKTAMEAFVDARIEAVAETANQTGAATAEINLPERGNDTLTVRARRSPVRGIWLVLEDVSELRRLQQIRTEF